MSNNKGKKFESIIKSAFSTCDDISVDRVNDPQAGYLGVKNICDFYVFRFPYLHYIECKTTMTSTLNFKSAITDTQWNGLLQKARIPGVAAGFVVWFQSYDLTVYASAHDLDMLRKQGKKSLSYRDVSAIHGCCAVIPCKKKKVYFNYYGHDILDEIDKLTFEGGAKRIGYSGYCWERRDVENSEFY